MNNNKLFIGFIAALLTVSLAGCGSTDEQTAEKESVNQPQIIQTEGVPPTAETSDDSTDGESADSAVKPDPSETAEPHTAQTNDEKTQEPPVMPSSAHSEQPRETQTPKQTELPKSEKTEPVPAQPVQPQTSSPSKTDPAEPEPTAGQPSEEPSAEPSFNIENWVSFAKNYAESVGLELDSEAVSCWDNPIIASAGSKYLERDLCGMLNKYNRDEDITAVLVWGGPRKDSSWGNYIGYA